MLVCEESRTGLQISDAPGKAAASAVIAASEMRSAYLEIVRADGSSTETDMEIGISMSECERGVVGHRSRPEMARPTARSRGCDSCDGAAGRVGAPLYGTSFESTMSRPAIFMRG